MTYKGKIRGNTILLEENLQLPEDSEVIVDIVFKHKNLEEAFGVWKDRDDLETLTKEVYEGRLRNIGKRIEI